MCAYTYTYIYIYIYIYVCVCVRVCVYVYIYINMYIYIYITQQLQVAALRVVDIGRHRDREAPRLALRSVRAARAAAPGLADDGAVAAAEVGANEFQLEGST